MNNYKELYYKWFDGSEQAISLLISAKKACEALYLNKPEAKLVLLFPAKEEKEDK